MRSKRLFSTIILASLLTLLLISSCAKISDEELRFQCCSECKEAWSTSPAAIGASAARCAAFTTAKKVSAGCEEYFKENMVRVTECS